MISIAALVAEAHGHRAQPVAPSPHRLRRVVLRIAPADLARVDALRPRFKVPRAALLRAFVQAGLALAEEQLGAQPTPHE